MQANNILRCSNTSSYSQLNSVPLYASTAWSKYVEPIQLHWHRQENAILHRFSFCCQCLQRPSLMRLFGTAACHHHKLLSEDGNCLIELFVDRLTNRPMLGLVRLIAVHFQYNYLALSLEFSDRLSSGGRIDWVPTGRFANHSHLAQQSTDDRQFLELIFSSRSMESCKS